MTSLRKRLNNILTELAIMKDGLENSGEYPSCCLTFHENGQISCDVKGPLPKEQFLRECETCRMIVKAFVEFVSLKQLKNLDNEL